MKYRKTIRIGDITRTERKIIPIGGSAATTLPKPWVVEYGFSLGDVIVNISNSIFTVSPKISKSYGTPN